MKKLILTSLTFFLIMLIPVQAGALEVKTESPEVWIGDDIRINCWYTNNQSDTIPWIFIEKTPSSWNKSSETLNKLNDTYFWIDFTPPQIGKYEVFCSDGADTSSQISFKVSSLDVSITDYPSDVYLGKEITLKTKIIEKSDYEQPVTSDVDLEVYLNTRNIPINPDKTYHLGTGEWIVKTENLAWDIPSGLYNLDLRATYNGYTKSDKKNIEVKLPVELSFINIDKTEVQSNDNVTITLEAKEEGNPIILENAQLKFTIDNKNCEIIGTPSQFGNYIYVTISVPELSPDNYNLNIEINYGSYKWTYDKISIDYVIPFSGNIKDSEDNPVNAKFTFFSDGVKIKEFTTNGGSYSGHIVPDNYNLEINFPSSKLILSDAIIDGFDDAIRFDHPSTDVDIPGIGVGGIFVFEIALTYSDAYLEMKYDDSKILDETEMSVYKCSVWNFGRRICNSDWEKVDANIDTIKNMVDFNTTDLSAFIIGYKKKLQLDFNSDKEEYFLQEIIKVTGIVEDENKKPISDVEITATVPNTDVSATTKSDNSGVFSLEFPGPKKEGNYDLLIKGEKSPYTSVESSKSIKILRSEDLTILLSESIRLRKGENVSLSFEIVNSGQTDFSNLKLDLTGLPENYYTLPKTKISDLKAGKEYETSIHFTIPDNAGVTSYTGNFKVTYNGDSEEKNFILSILDYEKNETNTTISEDFKFPTIIIPTGEMILKGMTGDVVLIVIVGIVSFSVSIYLKTRVSHSGLHKKPRIKFKEGEGRKDIENLLIGIKKEIEKPSKKKSKKRKKRKKSKKGKKNSKKRKKKKHISIGS